MGKKKSDVNIVTGKRKASSVIQQTINEKKVVQAAEDATKGGK